MYKTRATRRDDGNYDLSYGKGSKKLTALLSQVNGQWFTGGSYELRAETKREAIAEWSKWAVTSYGSDDSSTVPAPKQKPTVLLGGPGTVAEFTDPIPQLRELFSLPGDDAITQNVIDEAPTRADQIRRWYAAFVYTGKEFKLPEKFDVPTTEELSDAETENGTEPDAEAATGEAEAAAGNRHPPQYRPSPRVP